MSSGRSFARRHGRRLLAWYLAGWTRAAMAAEAGVTTSTVNRAFWVMGNPDLATARRWYVELYDQRIAEACARCRT